MRARFMFLFQPGLLVAFLIASAPSPAGAAGSQSGAEPQDVGSRSLFATYCAACHGASGKGDGPVAAHLTPHPANLTLIAKKNNGVFPIDKITMIVDGRQRVKPHGDTQMPVWGDALSKSLERPDRAGVDAKIKAVVAYVKSIQEP